MSSIVRDLLGGAPDAHEPAMRLADRKRAASPKPADAPAPAILAAVLLALLLARAVASGLAPGWFWGIGFWRFLPSSMASGGALLMELACIPRFGRWIGDRLGREEAPLPLAHGLVLAVLLAALAGALPDRVHYTGDSDKRQASFIVSGDPRRMFPQAMPADLALHRELPRTLEALAHVSPDVTTRAFGVVEAGAMGLAGWTFARALGLGGPSGFAAATVIVFGGWLALFGGYLKPFSEFAPLVAFAAAALVSIARRGRGLGRLGILTAACVLLHREGLAVLGGFATGWLVALTVRRRETPWRSPGPWIGLAAVATATTLAAPRVFALRSFDLARNLAPPEVRAHGAWIAALSPVRLADLANVILLLAPLSVAIPLLLGPLARRRRTELLALAGLALPLLGLAAIFHPQQGVFRDWDPFIAAGVSLAAIAAVLVAETIRGDRRRAWLAVAVAVSLAVPAVEWEWLQTDVSHGLARVDAIVKGPPARAADVRAISFDWAGMHRLGLGQYVEASECFGQAAALAPNPRFFVQWGMAESMKGDAAAARARYERAIALDSLQVLAWKGLAASSSTLGDAAGVARACAALRRLAPGDPVTKDAERWLAGRPAR